MSAKHVRYHLLLVVMTALHCRWAFSHLALNQPGRASASGREMGGRVDDLGVMQGSGRRRERRATFGSRS